MITTPSYAQPLAKPSIPFVDLNALHAPILGELEAAGLRVIRGGWYIGGKEVAQFEAEFAARCGVAHAVGVSNGLDALHLLLRAAEIGPGDEVIVPAHTFVATWLAVTMAGATVVPVDVERDSFNIDPQRVADALTTKTKAVIAVHLFGQPASMAPLFALVRDRGVRLFEDAAQAHGAASAGAAVGSLGDGAAFSFYPGKNLGALGDAGAVTTCHADLADRVRKLGNYGSAVKYQHDMCGFNNRLDPIQAAFLRVKLSHLDGWNRQRQQQSLQYNVGLGELHEAGRLHLPHAAHDRTHVWHQYVVRTPQRDALRKFLADNGVETLIHYPLPPHLQPAYRDLGFARGDFPNAESQSESSLSLPLGSHVTPECQARIIDTICRFFKDADRQATKHSEGSLHEPSERLLARHRERHDVRCQ